jgi:hypothetical protein
MCVRNVLAYLLYCLLVQLYIPDKPSSVAGDKVNFQTVWFNFFAYLVCRNFKRVAVSTAENDQKK